MEFDFEKELEACRKKKRDDEEIVYALGVGRMMPLPTDKRAVKKAIKRSFEYTKKLEGFKGVHSADLWHNLLIFDTLNNAKAAKNMLKSKEVDTGNYIVPILVEKRYL